MRIALLSPYHGGSHRAWAEGWAARSRHQIEIVGLPDQFWKWRMHGGAVRLADEYLRRFHGAGGSTPAPEGPRSSKRSASAPEEATPTGRWPPPPAGSSPGRSALPPAGSSPGRSARTPAGSSPGRSAPPPAGSSPGRSARTRAGSAAAGSPVALGLPPSIDLIVTTDMLDLTTFLALTRDATARVPVLYYAHENQWTYPLPADPTTGPMRRQKGERDRHYAWINFVSMLAADRIAFNSAFHRREYLSSLPAFLNHYPDEKDPAWIDRIEAHSSVLPLGIDLSRLDVGAGDSSRGSRATPPLVLWNHRWEYDKDPGAFFRAIDAIAAMGIPFRLAVCGTNVRTHTPEFDEARQRHAARIVHWGAAGDRAYADLLRSSDFVVSTARHEFFGISVCEGVYCGAYPFLPNRLSYPELIPAEFHDGVLYDGTDQLIARLAAAISDPSRLESAREKLQFEMSRHCWSRRASEYDDQVGVWFGGRSSRTLRD